MGNAHNNFQLSNLLLLQIVIACLNRFSLYSIGHKGVDWTTQLFGQGMLQTINDCTMKKALKIAQLHHFHKAAWGIFTDFFITMLSYHHKSTIWNVLAITPFEILYKNVACSLFQVFNENGRPALMDGLTHPTNDYINAMTNDQPPQINAQL